jgi:hypothetical protein
MSHGALDVFPSPSTAGSGSRLPSTPAPPVGAVPPRIRLPPASLQVAAARLPGPCRPPSPASTRRSGRGSIRWLARRSPSCLLSPSPAPKRAAVHRVCPQAQGGAPGPGYDAAAAATVDQLAEAGDAFYAREILALLNHRPPGPAAGTPLLRSTFYFKEALRVALNTAAASSAASMAVDSAPKAFSEVSLMLQFAHSRHRRPRGWSPRHRRTRRLPLRWSGHRPRTSMRSQLEKKLSRMPHLLLVPPTASCRRTGWTPSRTARRTRASPLP